MNELYGMQQIAVWLVAVDNINLPVLDFVHCSSRPTLLSLTFVRQANANVCGFYTAQLCQPRSHRNVNETIHGAHL